MLEPHHSLWVTVWCGWRSSYEMWFTGKAIVECSPNKMVVSLEKASMPDIDKNFLRLRDESCSLTSNSTHITGSMSFSTCGTKFEVWRNIYILHLNEISLVVSVIPAACFTPLLLSPTQDKGDFIVFNNEINSFELPNEVIVRRKTVKIGFSCQFPKTISISSYYTLKKSEYIFTESSFGSFGYSFEIYRDSNFTNRVEASAYPVQVKLMEPLYIGIQAQSDLPDVKLFVESCKGTPDDNPENALSYDLIRNGWVLVNELICKRIRYCLSLTAPSSVCVCYNSCLWQVYPGRDT